MENSAMFNHMDYVYSVYKERSFSKAAEALHISQPSLSATIQKIEEQVGAPIFDRSTRPISLTLFGAAYIQSIEQIQEIQENLFNMANDLSELQKGKISIGGSNLSISYVLPQKIVAFKSDFPNVSLRIEEGSTVHCKTLLDTGEIDLMVTNHPLNTKEYERLLCYRENLVLAVPRKYIMDSYLLSRKLSSRELGNKIFSIPDERCVSPAELGEIPFILLHNGNYLRLCSDMIFKEAHVEPEIILEVGASAIAYNYANLGLGAAILSNVLVQHVQKNNQLLFFKLNSPYAVRDAFICYRKNRYTSAAMKKFIEYLTGP